MKSSKKLTPSEYEQKMRELEREFRVEHHIGSYGESKRYITPRKQRIK